MTLIYLGLLLLGGGVLTLQLMLGHHAGGGDAGDAPQLGDGGDAGEGGDAGDGGDGDGEASTSGAGALFLSLRFWSFACLAAGLCGTLCTLFALLSGLPLALLSGALGVGCGTATSLAMRALQRGSAGTSQKIVGQVGRVLLPPRSGSRGRVRLLVGGQVTDLLAVSDDDTLAAGDEVLVLAQKGADVEVTRMEPLAIESPKS
jgi:membrane protein implicated in regulation of membrane protease activity